MSDDEWTGAGECLDQPLLQRLRQTIENESAVVVEHRFYRGARAPHRFVCDDFAALERYLTTSVAPGDSFHFWRFEDTCRDDNIIERGKVPDAQGRVPKGGAY
jgi:hypothetical protein